MGKVISHNRGKVWEKTNNPKLCVSQIFLVTQKMGKLNSHSKKMGKHKRFKVKGFLNFLYEA